MIYAVFLFYFYVNLNGFRHIFLLQDIFAVDFQENTLIIKIRMKVGLEILSVKGHCFEVYPGLPPNLEFWKANVVEVVLSDHFP